MGHPGPQALLALPVINYSSKNPELLPVLCLSKYLHIFITVQQLGWYVWPEAVLMMGVGLACAGASLCAS